MDQPLPILMENAIQIAWDYLERTGQIQDAHLASKFLADNIELMIRKGERRRLLLSNNAISAYERTMATKSRLDPKSKSDGWAIEQSPTPTIQ